MDESSSTMQMNETMRYAFMHLEHLNKDPHGKNYRKLYELSKRYMTTRGYSEATRDLTSRILPNLEEQTKKGSKHARNTLYNSLLNAYIDTYSEEI